MIIGQDQVRHYNMVLTENQCEKPLFNFGFRSS